MDMTFDGVGVNALDNKYTIGFKASGRMNRRDFGMNPNVPLVGDGVELIISAALQKQDKGNTSNH